MADLSTVIKRPFVTLAEYDRLKRKAALVGELVGACQCIWAGVPDTLRRELEGEVKPQLLTQLVVMLGGLKKLQAAIKKALDIPSACGFYPGEAHHSDYGKPLEVVWLCYKCHRIEYKKKAEAQP